LLLNSPDESSNKEIDATLYRVGGWSDQATELKGFDSPAARRD
jgi:hypothetical protein